MEQITHLRELVEAGRERAGVGHTRPRSDDPRQLAARARARLEAAGKALKEQQVA